MAKGFWVKVKPQADFYGTATWKAVSNIWVKTTSTSWQSVSDMWVKVKPSSDVYGTATWKTLYSAGTAPDTPIQLLTSYNSTELLRLQGRNYKWSPTPTTLQYKFVVVDVQDNMTSDITDWVTTSNPTSGSVTLPTSTTYVTIPNDASYIYPGTTNRVQFVVRGTASSGLLFTFKDEFSLVLPKAPTVVATPISSTQVKLNITRDTTDAVGVAKRYIVYLYDGTNYRYAGNTVGITGLGGYNVSETGNEITIGGLSTGIEYQFIVTPITGSAGSTMSNYYGYVGSDGGATSATLTPYTFTFGKVLHVGTNGYIGLDAAATSDSITSAGTGRFLGIFPADLGQLNATSLWYWSDTSKFIIRWEGTGYNQPSQTRAYQVTFYKDQSYATVYMIDVTGGSPGNQAMVKDGTVQTTYPSTPATGSAYNVYFNGTTAPVAFLGASAQPKSTMVQVTGLTSGTLDQGYTSITTSTDQGVEAIPQAFTTISFTKSFPSSGSQGVLRTTTLSWNASTNATRYEILYEGKNLADTTWNVVQSFNASAYETDTSNGRIWSSPQTTGNLPYYTQMRAKVRASNPDSTTKPISDSDQYIEAAGAAPGNPTFGTISKGSTTASIPFTVGTTGSNYLESSIEYQFRTSTGSYPTSWSTSTISGTTGTISLSSLSTGTLYYIKIRTRNFDGLYSSEVETDFTTNSSPIQSVTYNGAGTITLTANISGPNWQIYWNTNSTQPTSNYYDAVSTTNVITDTLTPSTGSSYWFWVRYSTANLGTSTTSGTAANGTYGAYEGPYIMRHINYNFNGGSDTNYSVFIKDGSSTTLPTPSARTGYTFAGWWDATSGGNNLGSSTSPYTVSSTLTAYARWTANTYTISYDANGGSGAPSDQTKTHDVNLTLSSTVPTRTDYGFTGWNTNSSGTGSNYASGASYTTNSAATLYAKWGSLYTISFDSQSGTAVSSRQQSTVGGSIAKPTDPTRTNYTFGGWATSSTGTTAVTWPRTPTASETLYAIWTAAANVPGAVRDLSSSAITGGRRISWTAPLSDGGAAITKYQIKRDSFAYFDNSPLTALSYDYALSAGTYTVYVRAVNSAGNGAESSVSVTVPAPFVQPVFNGTYPKFSTTTTSNFQRVTTGTANFRWGWGNGTFSFSGGVDTSLNKGWNWHFGSTQLSAGTARTATSYKSFQTTNDTRITVQGVYHPNLVWSGGNSPEVTYNANPRYLSIQAFCFGTDGNEYNGSWTGGI